MLVATLAGAKGAASPRIARSGPAHSGAGAGHLRNKNDHTTPCVAASLRARRMHTTELNLGEWPACTAGRVDRRAATAHRRTTNEAGIRPLPAGVRSAQRWRKAQALSPRATARVRRSEMSAVVGLALSSEI